MLKIIKPLILVTLLMISGCNVLVEDAIEDALERKYDNKLQSGGQCKSIELSCSPTEYYNEWQTPSGDIICQCQ